MGLIRLERSDKRFNCRKEETENGTFIVCEPVELIDGREKAIGKEPIKFRIEGRSAILVNDGGVDLKTLKELDEKVLEMFLRG